MVQSYFLGTTCQLTFRRTMKSSIVSSSQPRSVSVGDFNNDHYIDIVTANSGTNTIGIFISKDDKTFEDQQTYSTGSDSNPYSVVVSDFNGDSYLDIAVANYGTNSIGIFLGYGNGTFADQTVFSVGSSHPLFVTVGDFNKDNRMDVVVVNYGTNSIGILLGYGNGSFQNQRIYSTDYDSIPYSVAVGDFNHDNQLDIAVANYGTNNIGIFLGYNNGTFAPQITYTTGLKSNPSSIVVGDLNNDKNLDITVSNSGTSNIGVFFGYGNGTFQAQTIYAIELNSYPQYVTIGYLNKDNALDIVVVDSQNNEVYILPGYGNGSFAQITAYDAISGSSPFCIAVADFNNDNKSDIAVANYGTNNILVLIDYSIEPSVRKATYYHTNPTDVYSVAVSDFNNDGILDIVFWGNWNIHILLALDKGVFDANTMYSISDTVGTSYICVGDLNNDNHMDIINADNFYDSVDVFLGRGNGTFAKMRKYSTGNTSAPNWVALGDFNNDNRLDIVSANFGINTIGIFIGNGDGTFAAMVNYPTVDGTYPYAVAVGDLNKDNYLDLVVADGNEIIIVFLGYGNGTFIFSYVYSTDGDYGPSSIVLADFNHDNNLDVAIANTPTYNVGIFLGYGNGTFGEQTTYSMDSLFTPEFLVVHDFNNDSIYDIAVSNDENDQIIIFFGYGNGSFELARIYSTGYGTRPWAMTAADFDDDKQYEFVVSFWGTGDLAILTEYSAAEFDDQKRCFTGSAPQPYSVTVGDFNNDNRSDIVVANSGTNNVGILFGAGDGTFNMQMNYSIGTDFYPQYVITCDVNKDNQLDIVTVDSKVNSISVITGYGNGSFAEQILYSVGNSSYPSAIASGDFNNDTWLDLIVANEGIDYIGLFFGFNYISFQFQEIYSSMDILGATGIIVSDFNNDNYLDIAAIYRSNDSLVILLGHGNGSFTDAITVSMESGSFSSNLAVGDFNNDSRMDIATANQQTGDVGVFLGYGNGSFAPIMSYSTGDDSYPYDIAIGDFNKDSRLDIVVADSSTNYVRVLLGHGNGNFARFTKDSTGIGTASSSIAIGDFNNDGNLDIVVADLLIYDIRVLLGNGNGRFQLSVIIPTGDASMPYGVAVGDFNNDNQLDIAVANRNLDQIGIVLGYGNGTFSEQITYHTGDDTIPIFIRVGDFNHDNNLDIAAVNFGTSSIVVLFGVGDGTFLLGRPFLTGFGSQPFTLSIGDFNNDNQLDIAVTNNFANNLVIFLASRSEPFGSVSLYAIDAGSQSHSVVTGDLDNDGRSDSVLTNPGLDNIRVSIGYDLQDFEEVYSYSTGNGSAPWSVALADFNNDTYLDIVVANSKTDNIMILLGYGNGTFEIGMHYSTGDSSYPYSVTTGDVNNDNISDIVVANSGTNNILLFYGYGNGTFGKPTSYLFGYNYRPTSVALKDLNQNNWMDMVIACYETDHVETLIKMCE